MIALLALIVLSDTVAVLVWLQIPPPLPSIVSLPLTVLFLIVNAPPSLL
jgi:hypothetical protein